MTEEEYNLELQARQSEHQQRVEQHLKTIKKLLIIIIVLIVFMNLLSS